MPWFFENDITQDSEFYTITGENANHLEKSLRMKAGEEVTLCGSANTEYTCKIESITPGSVTVKVLSQALCQNEPTVNVTLYQAIPKGDKMDMIVQKAVELGVTSIVPVLTSRCVSRPDQKSAAKKTARWQKIALQAASQSRRGTIPTVQPMVTFSQAVKESSCSTKIIFYECGGSSIGDIIKPNTKNLAVFIGSEGGFAPSEIDAIKKYGGQTATLGKRILRAETAPLAALSVIMYITGNFDL